MPANFKKFNNMYKNRRPSSFSRRTLLKKGSFTALDVVRLKTNSLSNKMMSKHKSRDAQSIISSASNEELVTTEAKINDVRPKLIVHKNAVMIDETDSESDEVVDSIQKKILEESLMNIQKGFEQDTTAEELQEFETDHEIIPDSETEMDIIPDTHDVNIRKCVPISNKKFAESKTDLLFDDSFEMKHGKPKNVQLQSVVRHTNPKVPFSQNTDDVDVKNEIRSKLQNSMYIPKKTEKKKLSVMQVKMRHLIFPQHQIESTAGTRTMKQSERVAFEKYAILKLGTFDEAEDKKIKENWMTFCQDNNWDEKNPKPFLSMKHRNKEFLMTDLENRKSFVRCLAHDLPNRCLYSVYHRFKNLFDQPHKTDNYSEKDDKVILRYVANYDSDFKAPNENDRPFADLAKILNRTRASVWRRYRKLKDDNKS